MRALDRALLGVIALALVALLLVTVAPGPFRDCTVAYGASTGYGLSREVTQTCAPSWWP